MYDNVPEAIREQVKNDDAFRESLGIPKEINKGGRPKGTTKAAMEERRRQEARRLKNKNKAVRDFGALGKKAESGENSLKINFFNRVSAIGCIADHSSYDSMMGCVNTYIDMCEKEDVSVTRAGLYLSIGLPKSEIDQWKAGKCTQDQREIQQYIETIIDFMSETALVNEKGAVSKIYVDKTRNDMVEPTAKDIVKAPVENNVELTGQQIAERYSYLLDE